MQAKIEKPLRRAWWNTIRARGVVIEQVPRRAPVRVTCQNGHGSSGVARTPPRKLRGEAGNLLADRRPPSSLRREGRFAIAARCNALPTGAAKAGNGSMPGIKQYCPIRSCAWLHQDGRMPLTICRTKLNSKAMRAAIAGRTAGMGVVVDVVSAASWRLGRSADRRGTSTGGTIPTLWSPEGSSEHRRHRRRAVASNASKTIPPGGWRRGGHC